MTSYALLICYRDTNGNVSSPATRKAACIYFEKNTAISKPLELI